ncbi:hypothetical protein M406DRAFT_42629 [Cryphonectria parasitica EP155]|uniref:Rhodopsin domain-containing protein n=1 Tax=Cryphonectria parasitica (strain ATCC 38755 / EP155) TaxID=660469 RepID=A0A9P4Y0T9_CRYP1|nr:uncharacterized protein M406DRAFT_42629 [Cryphonectria parasitica EP155]KAF3764307.1 hypothetical protein M406DRAFT_42629 [Cryphonectria parasitica EP155]
MMSSHLVFPRVDLCTVPSGAPPAGQTSNFKDPPTLAPLVISIATITIVWACIFVIVRLWANIKRLTWSDGSLLAHRFLHAGTEMQLSCYFQKTHSAQAWLRMTGSLTIKIILSTIGLCLAKAATLLLFYELFQISKAMRVAIQIGLTLNFILYATLLVTSSYYMVPRNGQTWDDVVQKQTSFSGPHATTECTVAIAALGVLLDMYIFILPLPVISRLHMSSGRRIQVMLVFFTALFGVVAGVVSLVYRIKIIIASDETWYIGVTMLCVQVEQNVAIIVSSAPGFAAFARTHIAGSRLVTYLHSILSNLTGNVSHGTSRRLVDARGDSTSWRSGSENQHGRKNSENSEDSEMKGAWLMTSQKTWVMVKRFQH